MSVSDKILDAIELLSKNSVQKAGYDKTIQAQILSCQDAAIGKYRCRYQDATIYAYSNNSKVTYAKGTYVYILVPSNDMSKEKTILGTTDKLGINYITQAVGDQAYHIIGKNCITDTKTFYLDTGYENYIYTIYDADATNTDTGTDNTNSTGTDSIFDVSVESIEQYVKNASAIMIGGTIKTEIEKPRQNSGSYGIIFELEFKNQSGEVNSEPIIRSYILDEDNMTGNPYQMPQFTRQYQIFDIDSANFLRIKSISIFNKNFPGSEGTSKVELDSGDIAIKNLEFSFVERMTSEQLNGLSVDLITPQGTFFSKNTKDQIDIIAQVKINGKVVSDEQNAKFFWGQEDLRVNTDNKESYNKYLGRGWKCLNHSNNFTDQNDNTITEWIPSSNIYRIKKVTMESQSIRIKVAIIYNDSVLSKEITIKNFWVWSYDIVIKATDDITQFYFDIGNPELTCQLNEKGGETYSYYWAYESKDKILTLLPEGEGYQQVGKISGNRATNIHLGAIYPRGTFKCSVYKINGNEESYLGTGSIVLYNSYEKPSQNNQRFSLIIENGSKVFLYDEQGKSPASADSPNPITISALTFELFDEVEGKAVNFEESGQQPKIVWSFPKEEDSLLIPNIETEKESADKEYWQYNTTDLSYSIASTYSYNKTNNQIKLAVTYKGITTIAQTNFMFVQQGGNGTNGTEYVVKITPCFGQDTLYETNYYQIIKQKKANQTVYRANFTILDPQEGPISYDQSHLSPNTQYIFFKANLYRNGEKIDESKLIYEWSILQNEYGNNIKDKTCFEVIDEKDGTSIFIDFDEKDLQKPLANIFKCAITYQGEVYYGTIPVILSYSDSSESQSQSYIEFYLQKNTGFRQVVYSTNGTLPQYNNSPFSFILEGVVENIEQPFKYQFKSLNSAYYNGIPYINNLLTITQDKNQKNKCIVRPKDRYDGFSVNTGICCVVKVKQNDETWKIIAAINVPIHLMLNRFSMANINSWDGNSIKISEEEGYILSPQVGAGSKDNNNSFTGIVMGQVVSPNKEKQVGLFGYAEGARTLFLNSKNGSAILGRNNGGQIIIDPETGIGKLYSGNFWEEYDSNGLPISYESSNQNGEGMIIDLSTPEIRYGNGNFKVDKDGELVAQRGSIGGWRILKPEFSEDQEGSLNKAFLCQRLSVSTNANGAETAVTTNYVINQQAYLSSSNLKESWNLKLNQLSDSTLTISQSRNVYKVVSLKTDELSEDNKKSIEDEKDEGHLLSTNDGTSPCIYSGNHAMIDSPHTGFYIGPEGISVGGQVKIVSSTGALILGTNAVARTMTFSADNVLSNAINNLIIYNNSISCNRRSLKYSSSIISENQDSFYIGTDGIVLGQKFRINGADGNIVGNSIIMEERVESNKTVKANSKIMLGSDFAIYHFSKDIRLTNITTGEYVSLNRIIGAQGNLTWSKDDKQQWERDTGDDWKW